MPKGQKIALWALSPFIALALGVAASTLGGIIFPASAPTPDNLFGTVPPGGTVTSLLSFVFGAGGLVLLVVGPVMAIKTSKRQAGAPSVAPAPTAAVPAPARARLAP